MDLSKYNRIKEALRECAYPEIGVSGGSSGHRPGGGLTDDILEKPFKILVTGQFNSGKSSVINTLLGEELLPTKALPCTAIHTEIYYGAEKKAVMYPKPDQYKDGDEPFEITPEPSEIKKYSIIKNNLSADETRVETVFEKMVIYLPSDILREGIAIIDSPGITDPLFAINYMPEAEYIADADVILYCICASWAYSPRDKNFLEHLNDMGVSKPVIVTTYFDIIQNQGEDAVKDFSEYAINSYENHTTRECCHFVNSLQGMQSKQSGDHEAYVESGYAGLEAFLEKYIIENCGKPRLASAIDAALYMR